MRIPRPPSWLGLLRRGVAGGEETFNRLVGFCDTPAVLILQQFMARIGLFSGIDVHMHI